MQPLAQKFIQLLESKQLLSDDVILELRRQVAESKVKLSPELIAKLLVDNGHLTKFQATKLIAELAAQGTGSSGSQSSSAKREDELGFAPVSNVAEVILDDEGDDEIVGVEAVSVVDDAVPIVGATEVVEAVEADESVDVVSAFDFGGSSGYSSGQVSLSSVPVERARPVRPAKSASNPWDSFRILGVGVILSLILVAGFFLIRWMVRGSAEDAIKRADDNYEQRSYETAAGMYKDFYTAWGTNEKASYAKVKEALSLLRRDVEGASPINALRTAEEKLPPIADESSLPDLQSDLAGALVVLAEKFNTRMDASKDKDQRKELMSEMEKLMAVINDPKFVGSSQRTAQAPTLLKIDESRARILREIRRDDELVVALREMVQLLEAKDVLKAYEVRKELINRYPLLEANEELNKLVRKASDTQRELVKDANPGVKSVAPATGDTARSFLFAHRDGQTINELANSFIYYKVKGSVYAIHAADGEILWSKFVGAGLDSNPVRLDDSPSSDVLVIEAQSGKLHRMAGENGASKWSLDFTEPILPPVVDKEDLVIATYSGKVFNLDAVSGQTKWVKQLPQPVNVSPCVAAGKKQIYQPADHSNIYVLDRQNGSCSEVYYLGHRPNGLKVPLVLAQGLLFAVENISNDSARIRILQPSSEGTKSAQGAIAIEGNVFAAPVVDRTRLLVQSDIGNTIVLDVESNNAREKVSKIASIPKNLDTPKLTWTAFNQNFIWLAESRLARFDLVVSQGKLNRKYSHHEGDQFVAPLQVFGKTLIHARRLQGNQGVRICAAGVEDGVKIWEVDLGEPIESIIRKQQQKGFATITSSGNYFNLNGSKPLVSRADIAASNGAAMKWFDHPVWLTPSQAIFLNRSNAREYALYSEGNMPLRIMAVPLGSAVPSCDAVLAGDKVVVGLNNGQLVMFDPITGSLIGSPYQPALKPNAKVIWNRPVFLADNKSLIVASDLNRIVRLDAKDTLRQLSEETLEGSLIGPLALIGNTVVGVQGGGSGDELLTFNSTSLTQSKGFALDGKLVAGPFSGNEIGLIQSSRKLSAITAEGNAAWSIDFPDSKIVGEPQLSKDYFLIATRNGIVWNLDSSTGQIKGNVALGQPLSTPPMEVDGRVFVGTDEGVILATTTPTTITVGDNQ